jgi:hypothetical protein
VQQLVTFEMGEQARWFCEQTSYFWYRESRHDILLCNQTPPQCGNHFVILLASFTEMMTTVMMMVTLIASIGVMARSLAYVWIWRDWTRLANGVQPALSVLFDLALDFCSLHRFAMFFISLLCFSFPPYSATLKRIA